MFTRTKFELSYMQLQSSRSQHVSLLSESHGLELRRQVKVNQN